MRFSFSLPKENKFTSVNSPSTIVGNVKNFINICKKENVNPLIFKDSISRTNNITVDFEHIFPIDKLIISNYEGKNANALDFISAYYSYNGIQFENYKTI